MDQSGSIFCAGATTRIVELNGKTENFSQDAGWIGAGNHARFSGRDAKHRHFRRGRDHLAGRHSGLGQQAIAEFAAIARQRFTVRV